MHTEHQDKLQQKKNSNQTKNPNPVWLTAQKKTILHQKLTHFVFPGNENTI